MDVRPPTRIIPPCTWNSFAPPPVDHLYFEGGALFPFRPRVDGFDPVQGWWLAEMALLAYCNQAQVAVELERAGWQLAAWLHDDTTGTQGFVARSDDAQLVAFRGTEIRPHDGGDNVLKDILTDIRLPIEHTGWLPNVGGTHKGFSQALDSVWNALSGAILKGDEAPPLWLAGHSLGGALATLAALRLDQVQGLYTYGSPRVGNARFARHFQAPTYRVVHREDPVTDLPFTWWWLGHYRHVGQPVHIDAEGKLHFPAQLGNRAKAMFEATLRNLLEGNLDPLQLDGPATIPRPVADHSPLYYALRMWNHLVATAPSM